MKTFLSVLCCLCAICGACQQLTQIEYFIDTDKGYNKNIKMNIMPSVDSTYSFNIDLSSASPGYHKLYIRARDSSGSWSLTQRRDVEVLQSSVKNKIVAGEYFFDKDPGYAKAASINVSPKDTIILQNFKPKVNKLEPGFHKLYTRLMDAYGNWSLTTRTNIEIIPGIDTANIIAAEYFFDKDAGVGKASSIEVTNPSPDGNFKIKIPYNKIPANADTLFLRVTNANNEWSITKLVKIKLTASATPAFVSVNAAEQINNTVFHVSVTPNPVKGNSASLNIYSSSKAMFTATMYSTEGKILLVEKQNIDAGKSNKQLNMQSRASGIYMLHVTDGVHRQIIKLFKE